MIQPDTSDVLMYQATEALPPRAYEYTAGHYINTSLFLMYWRKYINRSNTAGHYINTSASRGSLHSTKGVGVGSEGGE